MATAARPRHPRDGGYARGEETRQRIIEAALDLFGENGFEGTSTRQIAARAGVNAPALQYYFENKEGLYLACARYIADHSWARLAPPVERAEALLARADTSPGRLIGAFCDIQEVIADYLLGPDASKTQSWRLFVAREQGGRGKDGPGGGIAFNVIFRSVSGRVFDVGAQLVSRITGLPPDDPLTLIRMMTLKGPLMYFHGGRSTALAALGWDRIDDARLEMLKRAAREQTGVLLRHWRAQGRRAGGDQRWRRR
ncbi:DUF1956 domain-containing protein [Pigmentiphaga soli]|uniref:DUF1956 domain-containing protein n=1 Tax=Pigmentiphaga soli TaxID=1007095 RepID=A0ABP8GZT2_9BURK